MAILEGQYDAVDTGDGWVLVKDAPRMGRVPKGEQGAPQEYGEKELGAFAATSESDLKNRKYIAPLHKGHHKQLSIKDPDFLGYALPKHAGSLQLGTEKEPALFGDVLMTKEAYQKAREGKLPYISVEAKWSENRISSVSMMDSTPPKYKFPLFIPKEARLDPTAKFEASHEELAQMADVAVEKPVACCDHCSLRHVGGSSQMDPKENKAPAEPVTTTVPKPQEPAKMSDDPAFVAQFAALKDEHAALKKRLDEREAKDAAKLREAKAMDELSGYTIGDAMRAQIAQFSEMGQEKLDGLVKAIKEIAVKKPPKDVTDYGGTTVAKFDAANPALAKFADKPPQVQEHVARLAAEHKVVSDKTPYYDVPLEKHVEFGLRELKAKGVI